jgi:uncharacterized membrane protein HdeD (DUF308 family)
MQANARLSQTPSSSLLNTLAQGWWLLLLRGIVWILFGVLAFMWPGLTLATLVLLYGAFAFADGAVSLWTAFSGHGKPATPTWWLIVVGLLGIAAGLVTLFYPGLTAVLLVMFIGVWALVHGIFEIIGAIRLRHEIEGEWLLIAAGIVSVAFGVLVLAAPGAGALALIWIIASYAVVFGILTIAFALRVRNFTHHEPGAHAASA